MPNQGVTTSFLNVTRYFKNRLIQSDCSTPCCLTPHSFFLHFFAAPVVGVHVSDRVVFASS